MAAARPAGLLLTNRRALLIDASFDDKEVAQRPGKGHPGGDHQRQIERVSRIHYPAGHDRREGGKHKAAEVLDRRHRSHFMLRHHYLHQPQADVPAK